MKINSKQNPQDSLYHDAKAMLGIITTASETVTLPLAEFFRSANEWNRQVGTWIMQVQGSWKWDDNNYTTFPTATTDLVANQRDYALPTTALKIERVEVLDGAGNYYVVNPVTKEWIRDQAVSEFYEDSGTPLYYSMEGNSVVLYPAPASGSVTLTAGLKIYVNRTINTFAITDTSTKPGFVENFHRIISVGSALDYASSRLMKDSIQMLVSKLNSLKSDLQEFYSARETEVKTKFRIMREDAI